MMLDKKIKVAILRVRHDWCPFSVTGRKFPKIFASTFSQLKFPDEKNKFLVKVIGEKEEIKKFIRAFKNHPLVKELELISSVKDTSVMSAVVEYSKNRKSVKSIIESLGCYHADVVNFNEGFEEWVVYSKHASAIEDVVNKLIDEGCEVKMIKTYSLDSWEDSIERIGLKEATFSLTAQQKYVFKVAYAMGYYDEVRKVTLDKIAKQVEMSKPAVWNHLHKVEDKIMKVVSELI